MDNGPLYTITAGAWDGDDVVSEWTDGRSALSAVSTGIVKVMLQVPVAEANFAAAITQNGIPVDAYFGVDHISDHEKHIVSKAGEEEFVNTNFSFVFYRGDNTAAAY